MKKWIFAATIVATAVAPLHAQTIERAGHMTGATQVSTGGFVGARVRIALGRTHGEKRTIRGGLTIAPMQHDRGNDFKSPTWRIAEGLELGFRRDEAEPVIALAGQRLTARHGGRRLPGDGRSNLSNLGTAAVVVVGLAAVVGIGLLAALEIEDNASE